LETSQTVADWEKAFCDQVTGSRLFAVFRCRITTDSMETAASTTATAAHVGFELEEGAARDDMAEIGKNTGKLTETKITVFLATDEALGIRRSGLLAFLEDDLVYTPSRCRKSKDVRAVTISWQGSRGCGRRCPLSELSKSLRGSGLGYYQG
jgi:hypothetical protein